MIYYKGKIIETKDFYAKLYKLVINDYGPEVAYGLIVSNYSINDSTSKVLLDYFKYTKDSLTELTKDLDTINSSYITKELKDKYDKLFIDIIKPNANDEHGQEIIYEKIYDDDGNAYAKELITGTLIPINNKFTDYSVSYKRDEKHYTYSKEIIYEIWIKPEMKFPSDKRIDFVVANEELANEIEVDKYKRCTKKRFFHRKNIDIESIKFVGKSNYLGDNISFTTEKEKVFRERLKEGEISKELQELGFLLSRLKSVSEDDFNVINEEYKAFLKHKPDELNIDGLPMKTIIDLQNKAKRAYYCNSGDCKHVIEHLDKQVNIYLNNYINDSQVKTELSISDLDNITEYILSNKNNYTFQDQNDILNHIALLYFFELYENKDNLSIDDLSNSYANDNIKRIIIGISVLYEEKIIKDLPGMLYEISTIDELLNAIKKIEFNSREEVKEKANQFIKRIQQ